MITLQRVTAPIVNAFLITAGLFYLMHYLVYIEEPELSLTKKFVIPPIVHYQEKEGIDIIKPIRPKEVPIAPPIIIDTQLTTYIPDNEADWGNDYRPRAKGKLIIPSDSQLIVALSYPPNYPNSALSRGIEGYAVVGFSVSTSGATYDAFIIESEPGTTFDRASLNAILKFKYKARTVNDKPVNTHGQRYMFTYELADEA